MNRKTFHIVYNNAKRKWRPYQSEAFEYTQMEVGPQSLQWMGNKETLAQMNLIWLRLLYASAWCHWYLQLSTYGDFICHNLLSFPVDKVITLRYTIESMKLEKGNSICALPNTENRVLSPHSLHLFVVWKTRTIKISEKMEESATNKMAWAQQV